MKSIINKKLIYKNFFANKPLYKQFFILFLTSAFGMLIWHEYSNVSLFAYSFAYAFERCKIYLLLYLFCLLHYFFNVTKLYNFIFRYRYILGFCLFLFLVLNKYNLSSVGFYNYFIQPDIGGDFIIPLFGDPQPIRSDEWLVQTPANLSGQFLNPPYSEPNDILRAADTPQLGVTGILFSFSILGRLSTLGYLFSPDIGVSFAWWLSIFTVFFGSLEFFYIITKKNKFISFTGAIALTFAPFHAWWSFNTKHIAMMLIAVVCVYYFTITRNCIWKKLLYSFGVAISTANFIIGFYPPWQIPLGYLAVALLLWIILDNIAYIKQFRLQDYIIILSSLFLLGSIVIYYLSETAEYNNAIMNTEYPGARYSTGGGGFNRLFEYWNQILFPYKNVYYSNPCERSTFYSLFPIPLIGTVILAVKTKDKLAVILGFYSFVLLSFIIFGWPEILSKTLLFTYVQPGRLAPIFSVVQVILVFYLISKREQLLQDKPVIGIVIGAVASFCIILILNRNNNNYLTPEIIFGFAVFIVFSGLVLTCKVPKQVMHIFCSIYIAVCVFSTININPVMKGLDVLYSKPVAMKIQEITKNSPDAKWIGINNPWLSGYLVANGAPAINSVNYIPNYELWEILDPTGDNRYIYDRYAHIFISVSDNSQTTLILQQQDAISVDISFDDLLNIGVKYIFSMTEIDGNKKVEFRTIYNEYGSYIYEVVKH